jgi:hypothetical protein
MRSSGNRRFTQLPETIGTPAGPSVEGASSELLSELLQELETELRDAGVPVDAAFRPGTSAPQLRAAFALAGVAVPDEIVVWFGWHDGVNRPIGNRVLPIFEMWSSEETIQKYVNPNGAPKGSEAWQWNPEWLHFVGDNNGIAVSCGSGPEAAPLVRRISAGLDYGTQAGDTLHQVVSLCTPVTWWIESMRNGWYKWDRRLHGWDWETTSQPTFRAIRELS